MWQLMLGTLAPMDGHTDFGMKRAEAFFAHLLEQWGVHGIPRRQCEQLCNANSVFNPRPYQKNIQTGTYRIWRDMVLGEDGKRWFSLWPFEAAQNEQPHVFEAYPTLMWRQLLGVRTRNLALLKDAVMHACKAHGVEITTREWPLLRRHADVADAAVLAMGGMLLQRQQALFTPVQPRGMEGWIAGLATHPAAE